MSDHEMSHDFYKGFGLLNLKHYQGAISFFQKDLDENPDNFASMNNMAVAKIHIGIGQKDIELLQEAKQLLEKAIKIVNDDDKYQHGFPIAEANLKWANDEIARLSK